VLSALLTTVNQDPVVNVRINAVDALRAFGSSPMMRTAIVQSISKQTSSSVQIALLDLLVDLKERAAAPELRALVADEKVDPAVREHTKWRWGNCNEKHDLGWDVGSGTCLDAGVRPAIGREVE